MSLTAFDEAAPIYDAQLNQGLAITGEQKGYYAQRRIVHLAGCLEAMGVQAGEVLDFGCGTGSATPYFFEHLSARSLCGVDVSQESLTVAAASYRDYPARFLNLAEYQPAGKIDMVFSNGVFHHIRPEKRREALQRVLGALRPGGLFAFWENNPLNPGTRYIMSRIPFDRDAIPVWPREARRMLRQAGFEILRTDFLFLFPRLLGWARGLEFPLMKLPLGGQYQVLCRKPG